MKTLYELQKWVQEDVLSWIKENQGDLTQDEDYVMEAIEQFVDSRIPVYPRQLLEVAINNLFLVCDLPDWLWNDESYTPAELITYNIYEYLCEETIDWYYKNKK